MFCLIIQKSPYEVNVGDHIPQIIFEMYETGKFAELTDSEELPETERDSEGFVSCGV